MEITQRQLDLFKQHFPGEESIQDIVLADVRAHAAASPVAWNAMDLGDARGDGGGGLQVQPLGLTGLSDCQEAVGWVIADAVLLAIGAIGLRGTLKKSTVQAVAAAAKPAIPRIQVLVQRIGASGSSVWARAKAVVEVLSIIKEASLLGAVIAAITSALTWWDALLFGIGAIATIVAAFATDGLALAAEIVLLLLSATALVVDAVKALQTCTLTPVADTTQKPALPPSPDPAPFVPIVALRTVNGHLLSVVNNGGLGGSGVAVSTTATSAGTNEVFTVVPVDATASTFALRTAKGQYVTAVNGGGMGGPNDASSPIHTDTTQMRSWERLHPMQQPDGEDRFAFATPTGRYLTAVGGGGVGPDTAVPVNTNATTIGVNETFSFLSASPNGPAAIRWGDGSRDTHLRIYDQDDDGQLYELIHEPTGVWTPNPLGVYPVAETGLAAVHWADGTERHVRIYYQDHSDNLCEIGWNTTGGWLPSTTLGPAAAGTNVAAVCWSDGTGTHLRVYYQNDADYLCEYASDPGLGWHGPGRLMPAVPGTAVAALARTDNSGVHLEVFTQNSAGAITSLPFDPNLGWGSAVALFAAQAATGIAAVQWTDDKGRLQKRVYAEAADGHVFERPYDGGPGWGALKFVADLGNRVSGLAAVHWTGSDGNHVRVYFTVGGTVWELPYDRTPGWGPVLTLPTPAPVKV